MLLDTSINYTVGPVQSGLLLGRSRHQQSEMIELIFRIFLKDHQIPLRPSEITEAETPERKLRVHCTEFLEPINVWMAVHHSRKANGKSLLPINPQLLVTVHSAIVIGTGFTAIVSGLEGLDAVQQALSKFLMEGQ